MYSEKRGVDTEDCSPEDAEVAGGVARCLDIEKPGKGETCMISTLDEIGQQLVALFSWGHNFLTKNLPDLKSSLPCIEEIEAELGGDDE